MIRALNSEIFNDPLLSSIPLIFVHHGNYTTKEEKKKKTLTIYLTMQTINTKGDEKMSKSKGEKVSKKTYGLMCAVHVFKLPSSLRMDWL